ncbi:MAG: RecX family transcriptional regulator [Saprospiraceae bacterium]|uniref:regulatory protein RecX n=1 Tax=Candidatus Brachybacter algidus TaxID=2982024 RepID=UPI00338E3964|nr:RecX family transcriptional regulator [Candidatus Brachybacter algidus]
MGQNKIKQALKSKHISDYCIKKGLEVIQDEDYISAIKQILDKRSREKKTHSPFQLSQYLMSRGFEYGIVSKLLDHES